MTQPWDQAVAYVQALRAQGYAEGDIWTTLRGAGWADAEIQALLAGSPAPAAPPPASPAPQPPPAATQPPPQSQAFPAAMPPRAAPPVPQPPVYAPPPAAAAAGSKTSLIIALVAVGAVVLVGLGVVAFLMGRSTAAGPGAPQVAERSAPAAPAGETRAESEEPQPPQAPEEPEQPPARPAASIPNGAGSQAALEAARQAVGEGKWDCALFSRTEDWRQVAVWCTPIDEEGSTWVYEVGLRWADGSSAYEPAYVVTLIDHGRAPSTVQVVPPWEGRPCQGGALMAARQGLAKDWLTIIASRARDWTRATVWVGPPASEYAAKITVQWYADRKKYGVVNKQEPAGDEEPPGHTEVVG